MTARIDKDKERDRLDELFEQVEAELHGDKPPQNFYSHEEDLVREKNNVQKAIEQEPACLAGNLRQLIKDDVFKTKRERILANAYVRLYDSGAPALATANREYGAVRAELEIYRNFVNAVRERLEKATRTAKEQDNHHYYKMFAESVGELLERL